MTYVRKQAKSLFFKRIRKQVSILTAVNICNTMIKPHFVYCSIILITFCTAHQSERLQKLRNRTIIIILKVNRYTSIHFMLDLLKWLNVEQWLKLNALHFIHKITNGEAPEDITEHVSYVSDSQPYHLRNAKHFRIEREALSCVMQRSLFYKGCQRYKLRCIL